MSSIARLFPPGPKAPFPLGNLPAFKRDASGFLLAAYREHGEVVRLKLGPANFFLLVRPEHVRQVLQEQARKYSKRTRAAAKNRLVMGDGLLLSEGDFWLRQRRIAQPAFHRQRIAGLGASMVALSLKTADKWETRGATPFDAAKEMSHLALDILGRTLLSVDFSRDASQVGVAVDLLIKQFFGRYTALFDPPAWIPTKQNRDFARAKRVLEHVVNGSIAARRAAPEGFEDLLGMLMAAHDPESGEEMNDRQLRDEVMTLVLAGHETVATGLAWTLYLLARHPEAQARLAAELALQLGGRPPTFEDLPKLPYTAQVVNEALRLYPPGWSIGRRVEEDDEVGGYLLRRNDFVFVSPFVSHRNPEHFPDPDRFMPERFEPARQEAWPRFAYYPFGGGPRQCIANQFALMESQLVIATLLGRFRVTPRDDREVGIEATLTLRPRGGVWIVATPR